jgi:hypothetical protein
MLRIGCPDRHALTHITSPEMRRPRPVLPPARAGSFTGAPRPLRRIPVIVSFLNRQPALSLVSGNRLIAC